MGADSEHNTCLGRGGVARDEDEAFRLLERAAAKGHEPSIEVLADDGESLLRSVI